MNESLHQSDRFDLVLINMVKNHTESVRKIDVNNTCSVLSLLDYFHNFEGEDITFALFTIGLKQKLGIPIDCSERNWGRKWDFHHHFLSFHWGYCTLLILLFRGVCQLSVFDRLRVVALLPARVLSMLWQIQQSRTEEVLRRQLQQSQKLLNDGESLQSSSLL